jgi:uncharacterized membrane protein YhhN
MAMDRRTDLLFVAALIAGISYWANDWIGVEGTAAIVWKGAGVTLLALWARGKAVNQEGRVIAAVLGLGALGDVLIRTHGLIAGAVPFLAGHVLATWLYVRHRRASIWLAAPIAVAIAGAAWLMTQAAGVTVYAAGLGVMAGTAAVSRFGLAGVGAALFAVSDLLLFSRMGPLAGSTLPDLLVWPTYFAGQALIAWSVVRALAREAAA